jgi:hypothetical protein
MRECERKEFELQALARQREMEAMKHIMEQAGARIRSAQAEEACKNAESALISAKAEEEAFMLAQSVAEQELKRLIAAREAEEANKAQEQVNAWARQKAEEAEREAEEKETNELVLQQAVAEVRRQDGRNASLSEEECIAVILASYFEDEQEHERARQRKLSELEVITDFVASAREKELLWEHQRRQTLNTLDSLVIMEARCTASVNKPKAKARVKL